MFATKNKSFSTCEIVLYIHNVNSKIYLQPLGTYPFVPVSGKGGAERLTALQYFNLFFQKIIVHNIQDYAII